MTTAAPGVSTEDRTQQVDVAAERARTRLPTEAFLTTHYLNSAGAALASLETIAAVSDHLRLESRLGGYEAAAAVVTRLEGAYAAAAALIGAEVAEIALTESATVGWQRFVEALRLSEGQRVLASRSTYVNSALQLLELERDGVTVEILPNDASGCTDLDALATALRERASLLAVAHVPTSSGIVEPVAEIGRLARDAGVPYLLDATQSAGQIPLDVGAIGCDALVLTGRKFLRAPRGTGMLYVARELCEQLRPIAPDVRGARWNGERSFEIVSLARRFESWEASHALRLGFGVALAETMALGVGRIGEHVVTLSRSLRRRLQEEIPEIRIADLGEAASGIVTFVRSDETAAETLERVRAAGCHVVAVPAHHGVWDMSPRGLDAVVRASFHVYNDIEDVEALVRAVGERRSGGSGRAGSAASAARPTAAIPEPLKSAPATPGLRAPASEGADTIVIGAGVHGASTAWQLARRGASVVLLEQFRIGHLAGSSHGSTRMIRRAYPAPVWDELLDRSYKGWSELEEASGACLVSVTGGLYAHPHGGAGSLRGPGCEEVSLEQARAIAPALVLGVEFSVVHDPAAGVIDAVGALDAFARLGAAAGVRVKDSSPVLAIEDDDQGVTVVTPRGALRARNVVVCAGPWMGTLIPELAERLTVIRIVNIHLRSRQPDVVKAPALPAFAIQTPDAGLLYGIPAIWGKGLKVGLDDGPVEDISRPPAPVSDAEAERLLSQVSRYLPTGYGPVEATVACRYTRSANQRFAVGPLPDRPRVLVGSACSGHGFKFAPAISAALADMVEGIARPDLAFIDPAALPPLS